MSAATLTATAGCLAGFGGDDATPTAYPEPSFDEDCIPFDPENVEIEEYDGDRWRLVHEGAAMLVFDEFENAKKARNVIQAYGFDDQCFVGRPNPPMTYWLADGGPASTDDGTIEGEDCIGFDPENLQIEPFDGDRWRVVDGNSALLVFDSEANAQRTIDVIRHYGFDRQCFVGRPDPPMAYWLSDD